MADAKISEDPSVTTLDGTELVPVVQGSTNKKATLAQVMEQLASLDYKYAFSTATTSTDPGTGVIKYNNATVGSVTSVFIDISTSDSKDLSLFLDTWMPGGSLKIKSATTNSFTIFDITSVTDSTGFYTIGVNYVAGTIFTNNEVCSVMYYDSAEALAFDTLADVDAPSAVGNEDLILLLRNCANNTYGKKSLWVSNNSIFEAVGPVVLDQHAATIAVVAPGAVTWTASNNGGKVRLTASANHLLTGAVAASTADITVYLHVKTTQNGWTAGQLHKILSVTETNPYQVELDTTWDAGFGVPVFSGTADKMTILSVNVPPMQPNSMLDIMPSWIVTNSANNKTIGIEFGSTSYWENTFTTVALIHTPVGIWNKNSLTSHEGRFGKGNNTGAGSQAAVPPLGTGYDTSTGGTLTFTGTATTANELMGLRSRLVTLYL